MKLANPRTIQTNINEERRVDIDNGIKLARKVDTLRETIQKEEQKLELFKTSTVKIVQEEIDLKIKEKEKLEKDIISLDEKRKDLLKPLDEEWDKVNEEKKLVESIKSIALSEKKKSDELLFESNTRLSEVQKEEQRVSNLKEQAKLELEKANNMSSEAQNCLIEAKKEESRITSHVKKEMAKIAKKEAVLTATVLDIELREKKVKEDEKFNQEEKIRNADMRSTLERALARLNK